MGVKGQTQKRGYEFCGCVGTYGQGKKTGKRVELQSTAKLYGTLQLSHADFAILRVEFSMAGLVVFDMEHLSKTYSRA